MKKTDSDIQYAIAIKEDTACLCLHFTKNHKGNKINTPYSENPIRRIQVIKCEDSRRYRTLLQETPNMLYRSLSIGREIKFKVKVRGLAIGGAHGESSDDEEDTEDDGSQSEDKVTTDNDVERISESSCMHNNDLLYDNNHNNIMLDKDKVLSEDPFNLHDTSLKARPMGG
ncbi:hypothetical protein Tco_0839146 [Tanacetum coccineum]|uniref:Uncharacterized protein n=1 Tax=Tanacetum coccineum TaxID=301880 RepID=A0ABQ5ARM4_9ASTR